jgi:type IV pilus assembly protein PilM
VKGDEDTIDARCSQIQKALQFFTATGPHINVDYLMLSGRWDNVDLIDSVQAFFQRPVFLANPMRSLQISNAISYVEIQNDAPALLVALGLGLKEVKI